jgi:transcriptional regulator with XRE-family HTH domain
MNINKLQDMVGYSKMSKVQIAQKCGITRATLDNALQGGDIRISIIESIAKTFDVPVGFFFDDSNTIHNRAIANGNSSVAAVNSQVSLESETILKERVKNLEQIIAEKERLINVLMKINEE